MIVWGIADLHLGFARPEGRERFADRWRDHAATIEGQWRAVVGRDDLVLIPGDISMARNHRDLQPDLAWLDRLPGTKVLSPGNHDRWWNGIDKIRPMLRRSLLAVGGDAIRTHGIIVCGARGAPIPKEDETNLVTTWRTELGHLDRAIASAQALRTADEPIYVLWHYPPFDTHGQPSDCTLACEAAGVSGLVYGHLHNQGHWTAAVQGTVNGVKYHCVAADAIGFRPLKVG